MPPKPILPPPKAPSKPILPADAQVRLKRADNARKRLAGGRTVREESREEEDEDEDEDEDAEWEWIYEDGDSESLSQTNSKEGESAGAKRTRRLSKGTGTRRIIGARSGKTICKIADCVLINNGNSNIDWVGVISGFEQDEGYDEDAESYYGIMNANIWWFTSHEDIHSKTRKRSDFLEVSGPMTVSWFLCLMTIE